LLIDFSELMTPQRLLVISIVSAVLVVIFVLFCEWLQARRVKKVAALAFGPTGSPRKWTQVVPGFRSVALGCIAWSLVYLLLTSQTLFVDPNNVEEIPEDQIEHALLLLDFSPSMMLVDAGKTGEISRRDQMKGVVTSLVERFGKHVRYSLVCFYTRPMPMVEDAVDKAIIYNVLDDLPIEKVMGPGKTDLAKAISKGLELVADKREESTTVIVVTDGDTVEIEDLHYLPPSVKHALVLGVGNTKEGISIDGHMSRQDAAALNFLATYLEGSYIDVNQKLVETGEIAYLVQSEDLMVARSWNLADIAMLLFICSACLYAVLPLLQEYLGSEWSAVRRRRESVA
jgi:Ca-activated chloride channel family protein